MSTALSRQTSRPRRHRPSPNRRGRVHAPSRILAGVPLTWRRHPHIGSDLACRLAAVAAVVTLSIPANPALATDASPPLGCEPITCAADYIGVPTPTLRVDIANHAMQTGTLGTQIAIDQLDIARARQLSALPVAPDGSLDMSHWNVIARHHAIRDALLHQAVTALRGVLGG